MKVSPLYNINLNKTKNTLKPLDKVSSPMHKIAPVLISSAAATAITSAAMIKPTEKEITVQDIKQKLLKCGYKEDNVNGNLKKDFPEGKFDNLIDDYGYPAKSYKAVLEKPISQDELDDFKDFIDINKQKGAKMFKENFADLFIVFLILKQTRMLQRFKDCCDKDKNCYKLAENIVNSDLDMYYLRAFADYKADCSSEVNKELRAKAQDSSHAIDYSVQDQIYALSTYIDSQVIDKPIKVYRGEGYDFLDKIKLPNGQNIQMGSIMREASYDGDTDRINQIEEFFSNYQIKTRENGFMSVSLSKDTAEGFAGNKVFWEYETAPNTKGAYVEGLNITGLFSGENEILLQKDSDIEIQSVKYDRNKNFWHVKAKVSN